ncbi:hypothetical protein HWV62_41044 [Athelia sp. TMB]|nr:hypothetical protein HWV62_41044 [Athelia sp. TMB]
MNSSMELPNQYTPMAYLTPAQAEVYQVATYIYFASLGRASHLQAFIWDWLMSMPDEYRIARIGGISISKIVYFCARYALSNNWAHLFRLKALTLTSTVAAVKNCQMLMNGISLLIILALNTNNILFFIRARAVYGNSRAVSAFFGFWFLVVLGTSISVPFGLYAGHLGPTRHCVEIKEQPYIASVMVSNAVYATLVFFAISYRIASQCVGGDDWRARVRSFFRGDGAPRVGKDLLRNGQLCYLATILLSIAQVFFAFQPTFTNVLNIPGIALENAMTCRVHRGVILGLISDHSTATSTTRRGTAPLMFTTVMPGSHVSDDMALKEFEMDTKQRIGHADSISDRV